MEWGGQVFTHLHIEYDDSDCYYGDGAGISTDLLNFIYLNILNDDLSKKDFIAYHIGKIFQMRVLGISKDIYDKYNGDFSLMGSCYHSIPLACFSEADVQNLLDNGIFFEESETSKAIREKSNNKFRQLRADK